MLVRFKEDWRSFEAGESYHLPEQLANAAIDRGSADDVANLKSRGSRGEEQATRNPATETTAERSSPRSDICGADLASGGVCKRTTDGSKCWQHEGAK